MMNDQDLPTTTRLGLSDEQRIVVIVFEICSSSLSVIGSSTILFKILRDRAPNIEPMTPYDRILLGLSSCDIVASITWPLNRFLQPSVTGAVWAFGNPATCQAIVALQQLAISAFWYNCLLSYYFLLTVLSQVQQKNFVQKYEFWMHLSVIFFPITAIVGLRLGWYSDDCTYTDPLIQWIVRGFPAIFICLSLILNNIMIYAIVRHLTMVQTRLKREATTLMFLYLACFFVTISPSFVKEILLTYTSNDAGTLYPLTLLEAIVLPLQGFFNFFIFIKPSYTRFRAVNPNKQMRLVLHQALFNPNVPQLSHETDHSVSNAIAEENAANPNRALFNSDFFSPSINSSSSNDLSFEEDAKEEE
jgi:hypothetical protein